MNRSELNCLILVGGTGSRLRPVVSDVPKPLAPVAGKPFLDYLIGFLVRSGIRKFVLCAGYKADYIDEYVAKLNQNGVSFAIRKESEPLGTAGALAFGASGVASYPLLALNGDSFFHFDLERLLLDHAQSGASATIAAARVPDAARFGTLDLDAAGTVRAFLEKTGSSEPGVINAGVYLLEESVLTSVPGGRACSIENEIFPKLVESGSLRASVSDGFFIDIGVPDDFARAQTLFEKENIRALVPDGET